MDQGSAPSSPNSGGAISHLQQQLNSIQALLQSLSHSETASQLERLQHRTNLLAGQIDQVKAVQERLSKRIGDLEEQIRVAEAHVEHPTIISTRVNHRVDEIERVLRSNNLQ